ncbi:DUF6482 family protein [Pseudomonas matsuisoli]|uniref:Cation transporter n=1 Tax=Pseudomonas matsuisoli TaxID=1515666 RepID=A0A917Q2Q3_9PSED|nr:DUF6482 family protein [Pseudomonas matsuisoli]GGK10418.1 hypothetical protein GCM10009304_40500 [Pseudomonas matsuisoli]
MTLDELAPLAKGGRVDSLDLLSLEGGIYLLEAHLGERRLVVKSPDGSALRLRSAQHARQLLEDFPEVPFHLVHAAAHDEMCGMPAGLREPLRVPISLRSAW